MAVAKSLHTPRCCDLIGRVVPVVRVEQRPRHDKGDATFLYNTTFFLDLTHQPPSPTPKPSCPLTPSRPSPAQTNRAVFCLPAIAVSFWLKTPAPARSSTRQRCGCGSGQPVWRIPQPKRPSARQWPRTAPFWLWQKAASCPSPSRKPWRHRSPRLTVAVGETRPPQPATAPRTS